MKQLKVIIKNVYGNETIYPACDQSRLFAELAKQKTLTHREIRIIKELGYTIEVVSEKISL